jgi:FlaA1/EpsC-like NDP-sugar epimerase
VFAHHRKRIRLLFAVADALLTVLAFEAAYVSRERMPFERVFFLHLNSHILLVSFSAIVWMALGSFQRVYEYLDSANVPRIITHTFRQTALGTVLVILFQYLLRLDPPLSRSFLLLFVLFDSILLAVFRWSSPALIVPSSVGSAVPTI